MQNEVVELALLEESKRSLVLVYLRIVLVPVLVFLFFLAGYLGYTALKVEIHSIVMLGILLFIALIFARHSAEYGCCLFERKTSIFRSELKDYIIGHLMTVGNRKKSNAPFDSFAEKFTNDIRNDNYASVAAGVFPMLGILGTFISIAIAMPEFSSTDIDALETEIAQLLGGVGTAFYVSIYGIFLALWWIYFEKRGLSRFQKILYRYKQSSKEFFWDKDEISQSLMQEILIRNEKIANSFETMFLTEFSENLKASMQKNYDSFNDILKNQENTLNLTADKLKSTRIFLNELEESSFNANKRYEKTISNIDTLLENANSAYLGLNANFYEFLSQSQKQNHKFIESVEKLVSEIDALKNASADLNKFETGINGSIDEIKKIVLELRKESDIIKTLQDRYKNEDK
ncbi:MAG: hypothetical protein GX282_02290 [Campylobacteraceae bacterium]|nr:hypothetical protein [Campylobacteraceae bacterium]